MILKNSSNLPIFKFKYVLKFKYFFIIIVKNYNNFISFFFSKLTIFFDIFNLTLYWNLIENIKKNQITQLTSLLFIPYWYKINFRGKGFRVRKFLKKMKLTLNFGRSHWTKIKFLSNFKKFIKFKRQLYLIVLDNFIFFYKLGKCLRNIKKINHYTKRGLRLKRQFIKKRFGKVSQIVSSLQFNMLIWIKFFLFLFFTVFTTIYFSTRSFFEICVIIESLVVILFILFFLNSVMFNLFYFFGIAFLYLILGGLELAINLLLLIS